MLDAVQLVFGHERGTLPGKALADLLELHEPVPRGEIGSLVCERVRPHDAADYRDRGDDRKRSQAPVEQAPGAGEAEGKEQRRSGRKRLAIHPRRADGNRDQQTDHDRTRVHQQPPDSLPPGPRRTPDARHEHHRDQEVGEASQVRVEAEVGSRPDAEELEPAERARECAELLGGRQHCARAEEAAGGHEHRYRQRRHQGEVHRRAVERVLAAADHRRGRDREHEQRPEPDEPAVAESRQQRGAGDGDRRKDSRRGRRAQGRADHRRGEGDHPGRGHLLDAAPQRVTEQEGGLGGDEGRERRDPTLPKRSRDRSIQREREHRAEEREVGLEQPGHVLTGERPADAERQKGAYRVSVADVGV